MVVIHSKVSRLTGNLLIRTCQGRREPPGSIITTQAQADKLPARVGSPYEKLNGFVLHVNQKLTKDYNPQTIHKLATEIEDEIEQYEMLQTGSPNATANSNITQVGTK
jgi:carbonic anhydrase